MGKRFVSIWFRYLVTDWFTLRQPSLRNTPFVVSTPVHGRMIITAANALTAPHGIYSGMAVADARAVVPSLEVLHDKPGLAENLLTRIAEWCIRFTPVVAVDLPDGLIFDASGCSHLWGGDTYYVTHIAQRFKTRGYDVRIGMADTIGAAWAVARFGKHSLVIENNKQIDALLPLPPAALRIETATAERLHKLGLAQIGSFIQMPRASMIRRFGEHFIARLNQALGNEDEIIEPVQPVEPFSERLPCMEPIVSATGIEIALKQLLKSLCLHLQEQQKGLRKAIFKGYRSEGKIEQLEITTGGPSHNAMHLFKLFENKIQTIEPGAGIELFVLEAPTVEQHLPQQEKLWETNGGLQDQRLSELVDRFRSRFGHEAILRYLPDEHYWPELSIKPATSLQQQAVTNWNINNLRPIQILRSPERIDVTAPIPDYPPMLFRYKGILHTIKKADGPERVEPEWWLQEGEHRDYYTVEDENGSRYWLFRLGHYDTSKKVQWYLHGFFA